MKQWLAQFSYHIDIPWAAFPLAAAIVLTVAICSVSLMTLKAARVNPTKLVRTE